MLTVIPKELLSPSSFSCPALSLAVSSASSSRSGPASPSFLPRPSPQPSTPTAASRPAAGRRPRPPSPTSSPPPSGPARSTPKSVVSLLFLPASSLLRLPSSLFPFLVPTSCFPSPRTRPKTRSQRTCNSFLRSPSPSPPHSSNCNSALLPSFSPVACRGLPGAPLPFPFPSLSLLGSAQRARTVP